MRRLNALGLSLVALMGLVAVLAATAWATSPPVNTVKPGILGAGEVGSKEVAGNGTWTESPTSYAYQWERCNASGTECVAITGATEKNYVVAEADHGHTLVVKVTAFNSAGQGTALSNPTKAITPLAYPEIIPNPTPTKPLYLSGSGEFEFSGETGWAFSCPTSIVSGQFVGANVAKGIRLSFTANCTGNVPPFKSELLEGKLGYTNESTKTVALKLSPEASGSKIFATGVVHSGDTLEGVLFGGLAPTGTLTNQFSLSYKQSGGKQEILGFAHSAGGGQLSSDCCEKFPGPIGVSDLLPMHTSRAVEIR